MRRSQLWALRGQVERTMTAKSDTYIDSDHTELKALDIDSLDRDSSPEANRTRDQLVDLLERLDDYRERLGVLGKNVADDAVMIATRPTDIGNLKPSAMVEQLDHRAVSAASVLYLAPNTPL